jgi:hypothetical protein
MQKKQIANVDHFAPFISKIEFKNGQWNALFFPGTVVVVNSFDTLAELLAKHVINEIAMLCCDALRITYSELTAKGRQQIASDQRMAVGNVLFDVFEGKTSLRSISSVIGWKDHAMLIHARKSRDVMAIADLIHIIYSRYPFLKDGFKNMY